MVFSSLTFLFFFLPITLAAYYAWANRRWRNTLLLFVSVLFYAWGEPVYIVLFLVSSVVNWALALSWRVVVPTGVGCWLEVSRSTCWASASSNTPPSSCEM